MECAAYVPYSRFFLQNTLAALTHGLTLITGRTLNARADLQASITDAAYVVLFPSPDFLGSQVPTFVVLNSVPCSLTSLDCSTALSAIF